MGKKHKNYERYFTGTNELSPPNTLFIGCGKENYEQSARKNNSFILPFKP